MASHGTWLDHAGTDHFALPDEEWLGFMDRLTGWIGNPRAKLSLPHDTHAIALAARNAEHLMEIAALLKEAGIPHKTIFEPDAPYNGAPMAIGLYPTFDRTPIRKLLSKLPLIR